jgi:hypothetical protein
VTLPLTPILAKRYLNDDDARLLSHMLGVIDHKRDRNKRLSDYYDGKQLIKSLGVAVSPEFDNLQTVVGWPATVVDALNERRVIDHIDVPESAEMSDALRSVWVDNDLDVELGMARDDQSIHGITFVVVAQRAGQTIVLPTPASRMTCRYERAERRITAAASRDGRMSYEEKPQATLYKPDGTFQVEVQGGKFQILNYYANPVGVVPVERFVNRPRHDRPWGRSEITPAVISYTNTAVRTMVSMEVSREFFAAPQRYALNIDPDAFTDSQGNPVQAWESYWGRFLALTASQSEDGETPLPPSLNQLPASSPAPMVELMKMLSQMMTAETRMPPSLWGFVTDNPASGDGARMYENGLVLKAKARNRADTGPLTRLARLILRAEGVPLDGGPEIDVVWAEPGTQLPSASADAVSKEIASGALPAESDVALEKFGHTRQEVLRIQQDRKKANAKGLVTQLAQIAASRTAPVVTENADGNAAAGDPASQL